MTCKHDWHFIEGTDRLQCARCKAETGPRTPDQLMQDLLSDVTTMGSAWSQGGKRIDPREVYAIPTEQLQRYTLAAAKPNHRFVLCGEGNKEVASLDFNGPELVFTGDADKGAQVFLDFLAKYFHERLTRERKEELNACCDLLEGMHAASTGDHNYYLHAAIELRRLRAGK